MSLPPRKRCPCGTLEPPRIMPKGNRKALLTYLFCPVCGLKTPAGRPEDLNQFWNETVDLENERIAAGGIRLG